MVARDQFEALRGEPIVERSLENLKPWHETSSEQVLSTIPVVSVHMITYNHGNYIRQAMSSVVNQQTDFPFEVIVSDDFSSDDTLSICYEFQRQYPDKVRVLWGDENVGVLANSARAYACCRGEYIAYCEGDDYWVDSLKLQKQVNVLRQHPRVSMVCANALIDYTTTGKNCQWDAGGALPAGVIPGRTFLFWHLFGRRLDSRQGNETFLMTASVMLRKELLLRAQREYGIMRWDLCLCDSQTWLSMASLGDVYYMPDCVSAYRQLATGSCRSNTFGVWRDAQLVRLWFVANVLKEGVAALPKRFVYDMLTGYCHCFGPALLEKNRIWLKRILAVPLGHSTWGAWYNWPVLIPLYLFGYTPRVQRWINRYNRHVQQRLSNGFVIERIYSGF